MKLFLSLAAWGVASAGLPLYIGCYYDCVGCTRSTRDLPIFFCSNGRSEDGGQCQGDSSVPYQNGFAGVSKMTPGLCSDLCQGFHFFGVQNGYGCFCGNDYGNQGGKAPESECNTPCYGDGAIMCGANRHNSIYAVNTTTA